MAHCWSPRNPVEFTNLLYRPRAWLRMTWERTDKRYCTAVICWVHPGWMPACPAFSHSTEILWQVWLCMWSFLNWRFWTDFRIIKLFRLENIFKIMESNLLLIHAGGDLFCQAPSLWNPAKYFWDGLTEHRAPEGFIWWHSDIFPPLPPLQKDKQHYTIILLLTKSEWTRGNGWKLRAGLDGILGTNPS